ncbi:translocation/assembly module TamB domain-containing protein [uncultured Alistipes sp.]|uniref:translocation/assembly module TamB domain-containing protein n=1 Tax=uncultured Alistipes sp. TaxID=538949 RepID=UPI0025FEDDA1|nr:translocation/assembly module TamB domain-containing protein [uncultured Alistipes sp.]
MPIRLAGWSCALRRGGFSLEECRVGLPAHRVDLGTVSLSDADISLDLRAADAPERTDSTASPAWTVAVGQLVVANTVFGMRTAPAVTELAVRLPGGMVERCVVRLGDRDVAVGSLLLERGEYAYRTAPAAADASLPVPAHATAGSSGHDPAKRGAEPESAAAAQPWSVRVGSVVLADNRVEYGTLGHTPVAGFDPECIALSGLDLEIDSIRNRGADIALLIRRMRFAERCGVDVQQLDGGFRMDSAGIALSDFNLRTANSSLRADLSAGAGALQADPAAPLAADLAARIAPGDALLLRPGLPLAVLKGRDVRMHLAADGTLGDIGRLTLGVSSPGLAAVEADGAVRNLTDARRLAADLRFRGDFDNLNPLLTLLPDTALRRRVAIPRGVGLQGRVRADGAAYDGTATLTAGAGRLLLDGRYDGRAERYDALLRCDSFPLGTFLPADSLGVLDLLLTARGEGFDPFAARTSAALRAQVGRVVWQGCDLGGLELEADLAEHRLTGRLLDDNEALRLALQIEGELTAQAQRIALSGRVAEVDLAALGVTQEPLGGALTLDAEASAAGQNITARIGLDSIEVRSDGRTDRIRPTAASFSTDSLATRAALRSGDLSLAFAAPGALDSLTAAFAVGADTLLGQLRTQHLDMERLGAALPAFGLHLTAGRNNIVNNLLKMRGASFDSLRAEAVHGDTLPLLVRARVTNLASGGLRLDTAGIRLRQEGRRLTYGVLLDNTSGGLEQAARAGISGSLVADSCRVDLSLQNRAGADVTRFGWDVVWSDSLVRATLGPAAPLFGSALWSVNPGNYVIYGFDGTLRADLDLTHGAQRFALCTFPVQETPDAPDALRLDMAGLRIASMLEALPVVPPLDGVLGAGIQLERRADSLAVGGEVSVAGLSYDGQRFGDVGLGLSYAGGRGYRGALRMTLDSAEVLTARGSYEPQQPQPLDFALTIPGFPLERANAFLPADLLRLSGTLGGSLRATGTATAPQIDGGLHFTGTKLRVPMIGTSFALSSDTIRIRDSRVRFDRYAVTAPNKRALTLDGAFDLSNLTAPTVDLALHAADFQAVNVARTERTAVYGTAYLDLDATARGPVDELAVRGRVALLGGTDITYVMQDAPMDVRERPQQVVSFVSFDELDTQEPPAEAPRTVRIGGMDLQLDVDISDDVRAGVDLSADGQNRVDLEGGGRLTYSMNPLGDVRLTGKYLLSGGTVSYNPPIIARKVFRIRPGSYVEWIGNVADPSFDITAVESVRANVSTDGQQSRAVNFDISITIRNSLDNLEISFGLAAPEDLAMQNELNSLTAEQRANQAMGLLVYNTYSGPGTTAKVATGNPLNAFLQQELNRWAQNSLKGVDLSFGIDSYGESDPGGQHTDYSYRLSKNLFGNRVRAVIGGSFSTDADPTQNLRENIIGDVSLEYMLDKRDNMFIKLFRHTGYESILEGEITETGVGFVIRKRLLRFTDLFRLTKRRLEKQQKDNESAATSR